MKMISPFFSYFIYVSCLWSFDCSNFVTIRFQLNNVQTKGYLTRSNFIHLIPNNEEIYENFEITRIDAIQISPRTNSSNIFLFSASTIPTFLHGILFEIFSSKYFLDIFLSFVTIKLVSILNSFAYSIDFASLRLKTSAMKFSVLFLLLSLFAYGSCAPIIRNLPVCRRQPNHTTLISYAMTLSVLLIKTFYIKCQISTTFSIIFIPQIQSQ